MAAGPGHAPGAAVNYFLPSKVPKTRRVCGGQLPSAKGKSEMVTYLLVSRREKIQTEEAD